MQTAGLNAVQNRRAMIINRDPTPILLAGADLSADTQFERQKHLAKRASLSAEYNARAEMHDAYSLSCGGIGRSLPLPAHIREKSSSWRALLAQQFAASIAIIANR